MILVETRNPKTPKNVHLSVTTMIVPKPITWRHLWLNHMVSTIFPEAPGDSMMSWWACGALSRGYWGPTTGRSHPASIPEKSSAAHSLFSSWSRSTAGHLSLTLPASLLSGIAFYWFAYCIMGTFYPFMESTHGNMSNNSNNLTLRVWIERARYRCGKGQGHSDGSALFGHEVSGVDLHWSSGAHDLQDQSKAQREL